MTISPADGELDTAAMASGLVRAQSQLQAAEPYR